MYLKVSQKCSLGRALRSEFLLARRSFLLVYNLTKLL